MKKTIIVIAFLALSLGLVISFRIPTTPSLAAARATETEKRLYLPAVTNRYAPPTSTPTPTSTATAPPTPTHTPTMTPTLTPTPRCILANGKLCAGYDMGVDDSAKRRDWLANMGGYMRMSYPSGLEWGATFIAVWPVVDPPYPCQNLSAFSTLNVELRRTVGTDPIWIGIKDCVGQGREARVQVSNLTATWQIYALPLSAFAPVDISRLYVVTELVFIGTQAQTVDFRNIAYSFQNPATIMPTPTHTSTPTSTPTLTQTATPSPTSSPSPTSTPTVTSSPTSSPSPSSTPTVTSSSMSSPSPTRTPTVTPTPIPLPHCIYPIPGGTTLCEGYDLGLDDSAKRRDWLGDMEGHMRMSYPGGLAWGAVFITVGPPVDPPRPGQDLSMYNTLSLELRGNTGNECVKIGIKDNNDPDNGAETKKRKCVTSTNWETFTFTLSEFKTADPTHLYVVTEFVFDGSDASMPQTLDFRNIQYLFLPSRAAIQTGSQSGLRVP